MRMKMVCDDRTLRDVANEFLALKKAQKVRERTLSDYKKYIDKFLAQSQNTLDVDVLKIEILEYFADIPKTSPARFNHPYQYLHALFEWCAKQDYLPYNPFQKLQLKKVRDEGNVQPAEIKDIQTLLKSLDKHNYTELRDYNIVLLILDKEGVHQGMQGWICHAKCIDGHWLVNFPQCGEKDDIAENPIKEEDMKVIPGMNASVNEQIKAQFDEADSTAKAFGEDDTDLFGYVI